MCWEVTSIPQRHLAALIWCRDWNATHPHTCTLPRVVVNIVLLFIFKLTNCWLWTCKNYGCQKPERNKTWRVLEKITCSCEAIPLLWDAPINSSCGTEHAISFEFCQTLAEDWYMMFHPGWRKGERAREKEVLHYYYYYLLLLLTTTTYYYYLLLLLLTTTTYYYYYLLLLTTTTYYYYYLLLLLTTTTYYYYYYLLLLLTTNY